MANSFSVSIRLQRVTTETAHVSVLLTPELMQPNVNEPGTEAINTERLMQAAIDQGRLPSTAWRLDGEVVITPHPVKQRRSTRSVLLSHRLASWPRVRRPGVDSHSTDGGSMRLLSASSRRSPYLNPGWACHCKLSKTEYPCIRYECFIHWLK